jgi:magnesium-transporting ATPase (P-type)
LTPIKDYSESIPSVPFSHTPLAQPDSIMAGKDAENVGEAPVQEVVSWHALTIDETIQKLRCDADLVKVGLSSSQAVERLAQYGPNKMSEAEKETIWQKIWKQVANVLVCILVVVALVSAARAIVEQTLDEPNSTTILTSWVQVGLITTVITVNTFIGIIQEGSAEKAAEALKNMLSADARVIRDGKEVMIPAIDVVPGDVIVLSLGDRCPADMRIVESTNLANQEAALTGEAVPIDKITEAIPVPKGLNAEQIALGDRFNMTFSATLVAQGSGVGIAIATGDETQIGTINKLVSQVEKKKTNVLEQIDQVSKLLALLIGLATTITFFIAKFASGQDAFEAVSTALVCCVAMIPEGLEAIVTLTYAWATTNMAKNNAIIRALPAVETLGSVTVICSDKTGTLTQNVMSLTAFVTTNAHYKFDVNATDRVPTNFVRDDVYLAERAQHQMGKSVSNVVKDGANSGEPRKGHLESSNHMSIDTSLHPVEIEGEKSAAPAPATDAPFPSGGSPDSKYVLDALSPGVLCSKCILGENGGREGEIGNPTELSILRAAYFSGIDIEDLKAQTPIVAEVPFSSEYKFMATIHDTGDADNYTVFVKGAPDRMVKMCTNQAKGGVVGDVEPVNINYWIEKIAILSSHGLRVLALCQASVPKGSVEKGENLGQEFVNGKDPWLTIVGLCAIMDPPRPECVQAIAEAKGAGVRVAMITGDHKDTATAIGHMLGIVDAKYNSAITGPELDEMSDDEMKEAVMKYNVFARASPQNKIRIVKALQAQKQICSMTGDGVNDAPALKAADMGVAMGKEGTDVAREASEMILADDNFATIVTAVKEGRTVWDNLRKVLFINTPINNAQGMSVLFGLAFGLKQSPLSPIQVLYSNLICAITLGFVAAIEPAEEGIMALPPRRIGKRLIGRYLLLRILLGTFTLTCLVVASSFWLKSYNTDGILFSNEDPKDPNNPINDESSKFYGMEEVPGIEYYLEDIRSTAFNVLDFGAIAITISARFTYLSSMHPRVLKGNKYCWYSVFIVAVLQLVITYTPGLNTVVFQMQGMDATQWGITILFMVIVFLVMEAEKGIRSHLKFRGSDTDDLQYGVFDNPMEGEENKDETLLPKGSSKLNLVAMDK